MYDPKKLEMKKHMLLAVKQDGRKRHAMKLKERFTPPPAHEDAPVPMEENVDLAHAPAEAGEHDKEKLIELLQSLC